MARPIEYTQRHLELAKEYLELCQDEERKRIKSESDKGTSYEYGVNVRLPSIEGLTRHLQRNGLMVYRQTLYDWRDIFPEFNDIFEAILAEQCERLINKGMNSDYNPTIAKLLMGKHGYTEKQEIDQTIKAQVNNLSSSSTDELLRIVNANN